MRRESPRQTEFGSFLTDLRKQQGYTQGKLGELAGLSTGYISMLETGLRKPNDTVIRKLCGPLDTQPVVLLVSARINTFDFSSTLRPDINSPVEQSEEHRFLLTESERVQVQLYIDFMKYKTAVESVRSSG